MKKEREFVLIDKKIAEMIFISLDRYRPHNHVGYKDVVKAEITESELKLLIASLVAKRTAKTILEKYKNWIVSNLDMANVKERRKWLKFHEDFEKELLK